jgi:hypothetical protein
VLERFELWNLGLLVNCSINYAATAGQTEKTFLGANTDFSIPNKE